jgi:hypothetical protein
MLMPVLMLALLSRCCATEHEVQLVSILGNLQGGNPPEQQGREYATRQM